MKRYLSALAALAICASGASAQSTMTEREFSPQDAAIIATGGANAASAQGFDSLFVNPAAFDRGQPSFTALGVDPGTYFVPTASSLASFGAIPGNPTAALAALAPNLATNGLGANLTAGLGYVGNGLGIGVIDVTDVYANSTQAASEEAEAMTTLAVVIGLSVPLGDHLSIGGAVRPMYRVEAPEIGLDDLLVDAFQGGTQGGSTPVYYGFGAGLDFGLLWDEAPISVGLTVHDIGGTRFYYAEDGIADFLSTFRSTGNLPGGSTPQGDDATIPMNMDVGVDYHPDVGKLKPLFDPDVRADYHYVFGADLTPEPLPAGLHLGAEVRLMSLVSVRAGYDQGYFTYGAGVKLWKIEIDGAFFTRPGGASGALPNSGASLNFSISF